jgi:putative ABC transport system permease protein
MFNNYLKIAWRNIWRNRQFTLINIAGLTLGISVFLYIMQYLAFEWSANRFNKDYDNFYRLNIQEKAGEAAYFLAPGIAKAIQKEIPAIKKAIRVADGIGAGVLTSSVADSQQENAFRENNILYVDGSFLESFSFPILAGSASLNNPNSLALSEPLANKMFGKTDVVGQVVTVSNQFGNIPYTVQAVYEVPANSDIRGEVLLSINTLENAANRDGNDWADPNGFDNGFVNIYLQLNKGSNPDQIEQNINSLIRAGSENEFIGTAILQPFSALHIAPSLNYPYHTHGNLSLLLLCLGVSLLILSIAWVNYINLSTAQAFNKYKDVGVRKVLGASRKQIIFQYLTETLILTLVAVVLALGTVQFCQPAFNEFTGKPLSLAILNYNWFWPTIVLAFLLGSLLSGGYVAFSLTSFAPVVAIRGEKIKNPRGISLRKGLVVFQFTISIFFIIATIVLYNQLQYMQQEKLGMKLDQLLVIEGPTVSSEIQAEKNVTFKNSLAQLPFVKKVAASNNVPGIGYNFSTAGITGLNALKEDEKKSYSMFICDQQFFNVYDIQFAQGNTFLKEDAERSWNNVRKVIINESAAKSLGFDLRENIIGEKIKWGEAFEIIGVVKDYHHLSLREFIKPTIYLGSASFGYFTIQTGSDHMPEKIQAIKELYNKSFPGNPFDYFFADEKYNQQYNSEQQLAYVFITAAFIAVFIACMGLFGLAAFSAKQRIKEIGIRKVLGASVASVTVLLSKDFLKLVLIAIVIATPLAWWAMDKWLMDFAYRTELSIWIFLAAGLASILIALGTISFQAIKSAIANPVESLRTE